jgi:hypothetical protein
MKHIINVIYIREIKFTKWLKCLFQELFMLQCVLNMNSLNLFFQLTINARVYFILFDLQALYNNISHSDDGKLTDL